jgi:16S rRNA (cytidine1402-2'-O)-methyltransferase
MSVFYVVASPIGNLGEISLRALDVLKSVDTIYCEDTRRSVKLLNHYQISKPLRSAPYFKEREAAEKIVTQLQAGQSVAYLSDAGVPGLCDPVATLVEQVRAAHLKVEIVGGVSALTSFIAGAGREISSFYFAGFLPPRVKDREDFFDTLIHPVCLFFESPHRIQSTLEILVKKTPEDDVILAKEISKISEAFYSGKPKDLAGLISSWKGEWVGAVFKSVAPKQKGKKNYAVT